MPNPTTDQKRDRWPCKGMIGLGRCLWDHPHQNCLECGNTGIDWRACAAALEKELAEAKATPDQPQAPTDTWTSECPDGNRCCHDCEPADCWRVKHTARPSGGESWALLLQRKLAEERAEVERLKKEKTAQQVCPFCSGLNEAMESFFEETTLAMGDRA